MNEPRGVAFPFRIDRTSGSVVWSVGSDKIREDLRIILGTRYGERPMLRDFGSRIHSLVHEPNDSVTSDLLRKQAHEALVRWERRVVVTRARIARDGGELRLVLNYVLAEDPVPAQIVVPLV